MYSYMRQQIKLYTNCLTLQDNNGNYIYKLPLQQQS